jgi:cadmium resistance protein CadD (predicted permease)
MMEFLGIVGLAVVLFVSTNIDDVFVLLGFFADPKYRLRHIIAGQYLGIGLLVLVSVVASLVSLVVAPAYVGLLGLLPIAIGIHKLFEREESVERRGGGVGRALAVAGVTIANGGDNIGVYTPVFATSSADAIATIAIVFAIMVAMWLIAAHWLVNHPSLGAPIRRYAHVATPIVLIAIGVWVLYEAGTIGLLLR